VVVEDGDLDVGQRSPIGIVERDVLVVVENRDP
jgi:hypothetical protein